MKVFAGLIEILGWDKVFYIAERQGLSAMLMDAIQQDKDLAARIVSSDEQKKRMLRMLGASVQMERQYTMYEEAVQRLSAFATECGLQMVILKGYGLSLNYPVPAHRPCGDIDVYVLSSDLSSCGHLLLDEAVKRKKGINVDVSSRHHSRFSFMGFMVENHLTVMDPDSHKEYIELNKLLSEEIGKGMREVNGVLLPSFRFYSIHQLAHMAGDFASTGTNLRRLLDWATFVDSAQAAGGVDWDFVYATADMVGMLPFLNAINDICVRYLGYDKDLFPVRCEMEKLQSFIQLSDRVFADLIACHEPVLYPSQTNIFRYAWVKGRQFIRNRWKYEMVYKENAWKAMFRKGYNSLFMALNRITQ